MRETMRSPTSRDLPLRARASSNSWALRLLELFQRAVAAPFSEANGGMPQFPGVEFVARGITLDDRANDDDAAIRASLIYFKHRWPGQTADIEGSEAFRVKVWAMADELGVPLKGPRPGSGNLAVRRRI